MSRLWTALAVISLLALAGGCGEDPSAAIKKDVQIRDRDTGTDTPQFHEVDDPTFEEVNGPDVEVGDDPEPTIMRRLFIVDGSGAAAEAPPADTGAPADPGPPADTGAPADPGPPADVPGSVVAETVEEARAAAGEGDVVQAFDFPIDVETLAINGQTWTVNTWDAFVVSNRPSEIEVIVTKTGWGFRTQRANLDGAGTFVEMALEDPGAFGLMPNGTYTSTDPSTGAITEWNITTAFEINPESGVEELRLRGLGEGVALRVTQRICETQLVGEIVYSCEISHDRNVITLRTVTSSGSADGITTVQTLTLPELEAPADDLPPPTEDDTGDTNDQD